MHRANPTHCFWHATDPIAPARSIFHRAELNLPTDPLPAEENTTFRNCPIGRAMRGASKSIQYEQPVSAARPTTLCAYEHGQNAARRASMFKRALLTPALLNGANGELVSALYLAP